MLKPTMLRNLVGLLPMYTLYNWYWLTCTVFFTLNNLFQLFLRILLLRNASFKGFFSLLLLTGGYIWFYHVFYIAGAKLSHSPLDVFACMPSGLWVWNQTSQVSQVLSHLPITMYLFFLFVATSQLSFSVRPLPCQLQPYLGREAWSEAYASLILI